jgi:hypothetical protein
MPAGGGLLQLVATGKQDLFLTGNPQISFFKMVYRRHTNFATESQPMYFDGTPNFGQRLTCLIPRKGDLLGRVYLDITLPQIYDSSGNALSYTNSVGHALISEITFEIGEQEIDRQTGEWMEIWTQISTPAGQRDALNKMIGRLDQYLPPQTAGVPPTNIIAPGSLENGLRLLIPLQFYFCNNPGLYIPLLALQYTPVRINITLRPLQQLFWANPYNYPVLVPNPVTDQSSWKPACQISVNNTSQIVNMMLWGDYVYLDVEERRMFVSASHEYLIEQVQYTPPYSVTAQQTTATISVDFNHPLKEFLFVVQRDEMANRNEWFNYSSLAILEPVNTTYVTPYLNPLQNPSGRTDLISLAKLQLDGYDRFANRTPLYFRLQQPYEHHTTTPAEAYIYDYSFALRPEDAQPTGTMNASRIDSIVWQIQMNPVLSNISMPSWQQRGPCRIVVYGHNYNVFRVINGFGGLLFTI